jgi:hypothetical protein
MKRSIIILAAVFFASITVVYTAHWVTSQVCVARMEQSWDELQWLRMEFKLSGDELSRIRRLHTGYLPKCRQFCQQIAEKKAAMDQALDSAAGAAAVTEKLKEIALLRAACQAEMLRHFTEVSRVMPPEQGRQYLAEMRRLTLGAHERLEESLAMSNHAAHGNP